MLSGVPLMIQAAVLDGHLLDLFSHSDNCGVVSEVGIRGCEVADTLVVAVVVVVIDEGADLVLKIAGQEVVFQQDAVLID